MLTAGGRAPPLGDLAECATETGAEAGIELAKLFAWDWRSGDHSGPQSF